MNKRRFAIVGAGTNGLAIANALTYQGDHVTVISDQGPSTGHSSNDYDLRSSHDLGLGNFNTDVPWSNRLLAESYDGWMQKLDDKFAAGTIIRCKVEQKVPQGSSEPEWADIVENYERLDRNTVVYDSFSLSPRAINRRRRESIESNGSGRFENRRLTDDEIRLVAQDEGLSDYEHTIVAMGEGIKTIDPRLSVTSVYELFVYFPARSFDRGFVDEDKCLFAAPQPDSCVLNCHLSTEEVRQLHSGSFPHCLELPRHEGEEQFNRLPYGIVMRAKKLIADVNQNFGLKLSDFGASYIAINQRPSVHPGPLTRYGKNVTMVVGSGRKAAKTCEQTATEVRQTILETVFAEAVA